MRILLTEVADRSWDRLLWTSGGVALAGISAAAFFPLVSELAVFFALTLLTNGPWSMFLPVGYEPILMVFGRLYHPVMIAALGTAGAVMVEHVNYRLFGAAVHTRLLLRAREAPLTRRLVSWFSTQPFFAVFVCALTPVPFWMARIAGSIARYSPARFLTATALGRFPRLLFYAMLAGVVPFTSGEILAGGLGLTVLLAAAVALRRRRSPGQASPECGAGAPSRPASGGSS